MLKTDGMNANARDGMNGSKRHVPAPGRSNDTTLIVQVWQSGDALSLQTVMCDAIMPRDRAENIGTHLAYIPVHSE